MNLEISEAIKARLRAEAQEQGLSVDALLDRLMEEYNAGARKANDESVELPVWHLGTTGSLRRRDVYDDVS